MKFINSALIGAICVATVAGCADKSDQIAPSHVSAMPYQTLSCQQLRTEAQNVSNNAARAMTQQDKKAANDAVATTIGTVLFWPALFMIKGDGATAAEVARLKGEKIAIEKASMARNCGINFKG